MNVGQMIEKNEGLLRMEVNDQYINKQRQITNTGRMLENAQTEAQRKRFYDELDAVQKAKGGLHTSWDRVIYSQFD